MFTELAVLASTAPICSAIDINKLLNTSICALSVCFCGRKVCTLLSFIVPLSRREPSQPLLSKIDVWDPKSTAGPAILVVLFKFSIGKNWQSFHSPSMKTSYFSGGNQQKMIIMREITKNPELLIVGQPTRGVDIGAIEFIHKKIISMRDQGKGILLISVELEEILSLSDRILVMFNGKIMDEIQPVDANEKKMGLLMAGIHSDNI